MKWKIYIELREEKREGGRCSLKEWTGKRLLVKEVGRNLCKVQGERGEGGRELFIEGVDCEKIVSERPEVCVSLGQGERREGGREVFTEGVDYTSKELLVKEGGRNLFRVQEERERREESGKGLIDIGRGKICNERRERQD